MSLFHLIVLMVVGLLLLGFDTIELSLLQNSLVNHPFLLGIVSFADNLFTSFFRLLDTKLYLGF